jgi:hypothetical protein
MSDRTVTAAFLILIGSLIPAALGWACMVSYFAGVIASFVAAIIACMEREDEI